eukprot:4986060-Pleurochrysis_carterae.AAC.1
MLIALVVRRTHAIVELFRRVRSGDGLCVLVALTLVSEEKNMRCGWMYNGSTAVCGFGETC